MGAATFFTYNVYRPTREPLHRLAGITTAAAAKHAMMLLLVSSEKLGFTTSFCSFWRDHSAPIQLNSTAS